MALTSGDSLLERLPESILSEILSKLEQDTLSTISSLACVSPTLLSSLNKTLSSLSSLHLSTFSLDPQILDRVVRRLGKIKKITLNCLRINESSITSLLGPDVEELNLLKCCALSFELFATIGKVCPNLRVLSLEFKSTSFFVFLKTLITGCRCLEAITVKVCGGGISEHGFMLTNIYAVLHQTVKVLSLQPISKMDIFLFLNKYTYNNAGDFVPLTTFGKTLTHLSLVLHVITDVLLVTISNDLPQLAKLDLTDQPKSEPSEDDLSDLGLQALVSCRHLTSLSLIRSRQYMDISFQRTTDMGMFLLSEGCKGLQSIRLGGFSEVTDSGYTSILNSCINLKKLEIQNAFLLTDLSFHDVSMVPRFFVEVKLVSCRSITSESLSALVMCTSLEVLGMRGCKRVGDSCLVKMSGLKLLTSLNLEGTDITDDCMAILGKLNAPISCLSLRSCKKVTDRGITYLLKSEGKIRKLLSSLDLGHMPGITDIAITFISDVCVALTELCTRNCFHITDAAVKALALRGRLQGESKLLWRLDIYNCSALSVNSFKFLKKPLFHGLQWIGIGSTDWISVEEARFVEICWEKRWLTICKDGCEVGCHDRWEFHNF